MTDKNYYYASDNAKAKLYKTIREERQFSAKELISILETSYLLQYFPVEIHKLLDYDDTIFSENEKRKFKNFKRLILEYHRYHFYIVPGAISKSLIIWAKTDQDAWKLINDRIVNEYDGFINICLCITKDDKDTGCLRELNNMFRPEVDEGKIRAIRASDLLPTWKK